MELDIGHPCGGITVGSMYACMRVRITTGGDHPWDARVRRDRRVACFSLVARHGEGMFQCPSEPYGPQVRRGHPLSLSISISGGEETYEDSPSNGERTGSSPA